MMQAFWMRTWTVIVLLLLALMTVSAVWANSWPARMTVGGFAITGISGSDDSASGSIRIPGVGDKPISLSRSSGGVTGTLSLSARMSGADLQGDFNLDSGGLRGRASIRCNPKTIADASVTISSNGRATGSGSISFGSLNMQAAFDISGSSLALSGSAACRSHAENTIADYDFSGSLDLSGSGGRMVLTARGSVQRKGKLADKVTTEDVSGINVDPNNGQGKVNVDGVTVTFSFFGS